MRAFLVLIAIHILPSAISADSFGAVQRRVPVPEYWPSPGDLTGPSRGKRQSSDSEGADSCSHAFHSYLCRRKDDRRRVEESAATEFRTKAEGSSSTSARRTASSSTPARVLARPSQVGICSGPLRSIMCPTVRQEPKLEESEDPGSAQPSFISQSLSKPAFFEPSPRIIARERPTPSTTVRSPTERGSTTDGKPLRDPDPAATVAGAAKCKGICSQPFHSFLCSRTRQRPGGAREETPSSPEGNSLSGGASDQRGLALEPSRVTTSSAELTTERRLATSTTAATTKRRLATSTTATTTVAGTPPSSLVPQEARSKAVVLPLETKGSSWKTGSNCQHSFHSYLCSSSKPRKNRFHFGGGPEESRPKVRVIPPPTAKEKAPEHDPVSLQSSGKLLLPLPSNLAPCAVGDQSPECDPSLGADASSRTQSEVEFPQESQPGPLAMKPPAHRSRQPLPPSTQSPSTLPPSTRSPSTRPPSTRPHSTPPLPAEFVRGAAATDALQRIVLPENSCAHAFHSHLCVSSPRGKRKRHFR